MAKKANTRTSPGPTDLSLEKLKADRSALRGARRKLNEYRRLEDEIHNAEVGIRALRKEKKAALSVLIEAVDGQAGLPFEGDEEPAP